MRRSTRRFCGLLGVAALLFWGLAALEFPNPNQAPGQLEGSTHTATRTAPLDPHPKLTGGASWVKPLTVRRISYDSQTGLV